MATINRNSASFFFIKSPQALQHIIITAKEVNRKIVGTKVVHSFRAKSRGLTNPDQREYWGNMTEIELKAHVADPAETERIIRTFAEFRKETEKSDAYWKRPGMDQPEETPGEVKPVSPAYEKLPVFAALSIAFTFLAALAAAIAATAGAGKSAIIAICLGAAAVDLVAGILTLGKRGRKQPTAPENPRPVKIRIRNEDGKTVITYKRKEVRLGIEVNDEREFTIDDAAAFEALLTDLDFAPFIEKHKTTKSFYMKDAGGTELTIELSLVRDLGWFVEIEILANSPDAAETERARATLMRTLGRCGIPESAIEPRYYTEMLAATRECQGPKK
jgi:adenylate cyclase class 2